MVGKMKAYKIDATISFEEGNNTLVLSTEDYTTYVALTNFFDLWKLSVSDRDIKILHVSKKPEQRR